MHIVLKLVNLSSMKLMYSLISIRLIYCFDTSAIIWDGIVQVFLKIYSDLQEICSIWTYKCFCYCFWMILSVFAFICCKFLANLSKFSQILEHCYVKWWLNYRKYGSVSYSFSCIKKWSKIDGLACQTNLRRQDGNV